MLQKSLHNIQIMLSKQVFIADKECYKKMENFNSVGCHNMSKNAIKNPFIVFIAYYKNLFLF